VRVAASDSSGRALERLARFPIPLTHALARGCLETFPRSSGAPRFPCL